MNSRTFRTKWLRLQKRYENQALRDLMRVFRAWNKAIDFDQVTELNYKKLISNAVDTTSLSKEYVGIYRKIGRAHGRVIGKSINEQLKSWTASAFDSEWEAEVSRYFAEYGIGRVVTIENTYKETIAKMFESPKFSELTLQERTKIIQSQVNKKNFYRWQAERIARTEGTAAANMAAVKSGKISGFASEKIWISATDSRTRTMPYDHLGMNGKTVGVNDKFNVSGQMMEFPGDQSASAGNVINCRCATAIRPKRDENGDLIPI